MRFTGFWTGIFGAAALGSIASLGCGESFTLSPTATAASGSGGSASSSGGSGGAGGTAVTTSSVGGAGGMAGGGGNPATTVVSSSIGAGGAGGGGASGAGGAGGGGSLPTCPGQAVNCVNQWLKPSAGLKKISAIDVAKGSLWVLANSAVYKIELTASMPTPVLVAGSPGTAGTTDNLKGTDARFGSLEGLAVDALTEVAYVADSGNCLVRTVDLGADKGYAVKTLSGAAGSCTSTDSTTAATVRWKKLMGLALDMPSGSTHQLLYAIDEHRVRSLDLATKGTAAVAGQMPPGGFADQDAGFKSKFNGPEFLRAAPTMLMVADAGNQRLRRIDLTSNNAVKTHCGKDKGFVDGTCPEGVKFNLPSAFAIGLPTPTAYVADTDNHAVRKLSDLKVTEFLGGKDGTVVGVGTAGLIKKPTAVAVAKVGGVQTLFVVEDAKAIRRVPLE
ncbi:MAG: hypothetical protein FJ096_15700 [Deltaproteobacteria bacterium]|nr:hypothetical protein [Deltaproteobacteria bacterium]